jgi:hypothetical protein
VNENALPVTQAGLPNCEVCKGTGLIDTESIDIGRPYYKNGKLVYDITGKGNWQMTVCYCLSEKD